jgi:branched-subunit amino acid aminotransferase/4-amino-4-deoxychorismate lyase
LRIGFATSAQVPAGPEHFYKPLSAQHYVQAGVELFQQPDFDDLLLCNTNGYVVESITRNIFWRSKGQWYRPDPQLGGVRGITEQLLLPKLPNLQLASLTAEQLLEQAEVLVLSNSGGVTWAKSLKGNSLKEPKEVSQDLQD